MSLSYSYPKSFLASQSLEGLIDHSLCQCLQFFTCHRIEIIFLLFDVGDEDRILEGVSVSFAGTQYARAIQKITKMILTTVIEIDTSVPT